MNVGSCSPRPSWRAATPESAAQQIVRLYANLFARLCTARERLMSELRDREAEIMLRVPERDRKRTHELVAAKLVFYEPAAVVVPAPPGERPKQLELGAADTELHVDETSATADTQREP